MAVQGERSAQAAAVEERSWRLALWAVFAVTVARLVWLALGRGDLYPGGVQYWLWARGPALCYYPKPPPGPSLIAAPPPRFGAGDVAPRLAAPRVPFGA